MSPFFKDTIAALLNCAQRHTHHEHSKVQISSFEAINDLVRAASRDTLDVVAQLIGVSTGALHLVAIWIGLLLRIRIFS